MHMTAPVWSTLFLSAFAISWWTRVRGNKEVQALIIEYLTTSLIGVTHFSTTDTESPGLAQVSSRILVARASDQDCREKRYQSLYASAERYEAGSHNLQCGSLHCVVCLFLHVECVVPVDYGCNHDRRLPSHGCFSVGDNRDGS
ncbi:hypothetical protein GQ600_1393 [Phytophthora cactorum]|nr:hypothetical protein GQ600_1393 [Phytophthora cactorum]